MLILFSIPANHIKESIEKQSKQVAPARNTILSLANFLPSVVWRYTCKRPRNNHMHFSDEVNVTTWITSLLQKKSGAEG